MSGIRLENHQPPRPREGTAPPEGVCGDAGDWLCGPMPTLCPEIHHGDMSAATIHPASAGPPGATAVDGHHHHFLGDALRAIKVFAGAAFSVVILGEYGEEVGIHRK